MQEKNRLERAKLAIRLALLLGLALGITIADTLTSLEIAAGVFQILVVLIAVSFLPARGVVAIAAICMILTVVSYRLTRFGEAEAGLINCLISLAAIACTTYLALRMSAAMQAVHQAREQLERSARTNMLGALTASIAHEVNQPLAAIATSGNASLRWMAAQPPNLAKASQAVERIIADAHRASEIIARIRSMAQRKPPTKEWLNVADTVAGTLELLHSELDRQGITLRVEIPSGLPPMLADRVQIPQVLLNLVMNAMEAMRDIDPDRRILLLTVEHDLHTSLHFAICDQGVGLAVQDSERVFDTFYTTKNEGMGIGLAISRAIIEAHEGRIWASVNPEIGATFHFTLPTGYRED